MHILSRVQKKVRLRFTRRTTEARYSRNTAWRQRRVGPLPWRSILHTCRSHTVLSQSSMPPKSQYPPAAATMHACSVPSQPPTAPARPRRPTRPNRDPLLQYVRGLSLQQSAKAHVGCNASIRDPLSVPFLGPPAGHRRARNNRRGRENAHVTRWKFVARSWTSSQ